MNGRLTMRDLPALALALAVPLLVIARSAGILAALPLLLFVLPLLLGRYPGEETLRRAAARFRPRARRPRSARAAVQRPRARASARPSLLIASYMAERGPPSVPITA